MLEEEKTKVQKLEQMLANKENEVGQLESVLAQSEYTSFSLPILNKYYKLFLDNSDALDSLIVQSGQKPATKVKEEPTGLL